MRAPLFLLLLFSLVFFLSPASAETVSFQDGSACTLSDFYLAPENHNGFTNFTTTASQILIGTKTATNANQLGYYRLDFYATTPQFFSIGAFGSRTLSSLTSTPLSPGFAMNMYDSSTSLDYLPVYTGNSLVTGGGVEAHTSGERKIKSMYTAGDGSSTYMVLYQNANQIRTFNAALQSFGSWIPVTGLGGAYNFLSAGNGTSLLVGTDNSGKAAVYRATNYGTTFTNVATLDTGYAMDVARFSGTVFVFVKSGVSALKVYTSSNDGANFSLLETLSDAGDVTGWATNSSGLFVVMSNGKMLRYKTPASNALVMTFATMSPFDAVTYSNSQILLSSGSPAKKLFMIACTDNLPPHVDAGPDLVLSKKGFLRQIIHGNATDPEANPLTYAWSVVNNQDGVSFFGGGYLSPDLDAEFAVSATYVLRFTVTDSHGASSYDDVNVTFTNTNHSPQVSAPPAPISCFEGHPCTLGVSASDPDNDPLTYSWDTGNLVNATNISGESTLALTFTPPSLAPGLTSEDGLASISVNDGFDGLTITPVFFKVYPASQFVGPASPDSNAPPDTNTNAPSNSPASDSNGGTPPSSPGANENSGSGASGETGVPPSEPPAPSTPPVNPVPPISSPSTGTGSPAPSGVAGPVLPAAAPSSSAGVDPTLLWGVGGLLVLMGILAYVFHLKNEVRTMSMEREAREKAARKSKKE